jgi:Protein of unknown function (DUF1573)
MAFLRLLLLCCFVVCYCVACQWKGISGDKDQRKDVSIDPDKANLGDIEQFTLGSQKFLLTNHKSVSIEIESLLGSCACTSATTSKDRLAPGESTTITVNINAQNRVGAFGVYVNVHWKSTDGGKAGTITLPITARAVDLVSINPTSLDLGKLSKSTKPIKATIVIKRGNSHIPWDGVSLSPLSEIQLNMAQIDANTFGLDCLIDPKALAVGPMKKEIVFELIDKGRALDRRFSVPIYALIESTFKASPQTLFFGVLKAGVKKDGVFKIVAQDAKIDFDSLECSNEEFIKVSFMGKSGKDLVFHFNVNTAKIVGSVDGKIIVSVLCPNMESIQIPFIAFIQ